MDIRPSVRGLIGRAASGVGAAALGALLLVPYGAGAATFTVNTTASAPDALPGDGVCATTLPGAPCTLRAAVEESNASPGADAITVPAGTYTLVDEVLDISDDVKAT